MKCVKCGNEFEGKFCSNCGLAVDGQEHCANCGKERVNNEKFCSNCGRAYEPEPSKAKEKLKSFGEKFKNFGKKTFTWMKYHTVATVFIAIFVITAIVLLCLIPVFTNIFKVSKVSKINIGDSAVQVEKILGKPYSIDKLSGDWVYYNDEYLDLLKKDEEALNDVLGSESLGDLDGVLNDALENEQKEKDSAFEKITVKFDDKTLVTSVCLDKSFKPNSLQKVDRETKKYNLLSGNITYLTTEETYKITYESEFTDGSYIKSVATASRGNTETPLDEIYWYNYDIGSKFAVKWSDSWHSNYQGEIEVDKNYRIEGTTLYFSGAISGLGFVNKSISDELRQIETVVFLEGVQVISRSSFYELKNLKSISIPNGVTTIGQKAFLNYTGSAIILPNSVTRLREEAFAYCYAEIDWEDNSSITEIGNKAFASYGGKRVTIPSSVTRIGNSGVFYECFKLVEIINKSNVEIYNKGDSFSDLHALQILQEKPTVSNFIVSGDYEFYNANGTYYLIDYLGKSFYTSAEKTAELILPDYINGNSYSIHSFVFMNMYVPSKIVIGQGVTSIGDFAFLDINFHGDELTITIPSSVTKIGFYNFNSNIANYKCIVNYQGTKEQAKKVLVGWEVFFHNTVIYCTDGEIE